MEIDVNDLFNEPCPSVDCELDVDTPKLQKAITCLPENFQIRTMTDVEILKEHVRHNYAKGIGLYRGHESRKYKIKSTIVRHHYCPVKVD